MSYKEVTIPMTKDDFACYSLMVIVGLSILQMVLQASGSIPMNDTNMFLTAFAFVGVILGGIFGAIWWTDRWDLNPIHAIGYCLRWKK